jgi:glycosyltransferase involved in cell wall biosynthesis
MLNSNKDKLLTVVTSTLNVVECFPKLANSIAINKPDYIEWIVVDGGSNDGTLEIIKDYSLFIDHMIYGPDSCYAEAWNKAIVKASGKYICFIGADDYISSEYFESVFKITQNTKSNIICFRSNFFNDSNNISYDVHIKEWIKPWNYPLNLGFFHPGTIIDASLVIKSKFDTSFKVAADHISLAKVADYLDPQVFITNKVQIYHSLNGLSTKQTLNYYKERLRLIFLVKASIFIKIHSFIFVFISAFLGLRDIIRIKNEK